MLALTSDAAQQSFLPQLVPRPLLTKANARLQQSDTVAQTTGGAVAGGLVALVTAPFALLLGAVSYFLSASVLLTLERPSQAPARSTQRLHRRVVEGLRWVYRHPYLTPLACSTHIWFIGSSILGTVLPAVVLNALGMGAIGLGLVMGCAGIGTGQLLFGTAMGVEGPVEMGFCQAATPDSLLARMSATMRSVNRGMIVIGAPLGGLMATMAGAGTALWASVAFLLLAPVVLLCSKFRSVRTEDHQLTDEEALTRD